jgi:hypothetical protein
VVSVVDPGRWQSEWGREGGRPRLIWVTSPLEGAVRALSVATTARAIARLARLSARSGTADLAASTGPWSILDQFVHAAPQFGDLARHVSQYFYGPPTRPSHD